MAIIKEDQDKTNSTVNSPVSTTTAGVGRDLEREAAAVKKIGADAAQLSGLDQTKLFEMTYSPQELAGMQEYQQLKGQKEQLEQSRETLTNTPVPSNSLLRPLEEALRMKQDPGKQKLGQSELFSKAGLTGYATLSASLVERSKEMQDKYNSFANVISTVGGELSDAYNQTLTTYQFLKDEYEAQTSRFQSVVDDIVATERAMSLLYEEDRLSKEMYAYKAEIDNKYAKTNKPGSIGGSFSSGQQIDLFQIPGSSNYRDSGWECAEASNRITDGVKLGSAFSDKLAKATNKGTPQVGNVLVTPHGGTKYGHASTVIDFDQDTGVITTLDWNYNGDGKQTIQKWTLEELRSNYGDQWGFTDSVLKPEYAQKYQDYIEEANKPPDWMDDLVDQYKKGIKTQGNVNTAIDNKFDTTEETEYYQNMFDEIITQQQVSTGQLSDLPGVGSTLSGAFGDRTITKTGESIAEKKQRFPEGMTFEDMQKNPDIIASIKSVMESLEITEVTSTLVERLKSKLKEKFKVDLSSQEVSALIYTAIGQQ